MDIEIRKPKSVIFSQGTMSIDETGNIPEATAGYEANNKPTAEGNPWEVREKKSPKSKPETI